MKKFTMILLLILFAIPAYAQETEEASVTEVAQEEEIAVQEKESYVDEEPQPQVRPPAAEKKMFVSMGLMDKIVGENFIGGELLFGYRPTNRSLFTAEFNIGFYDAGKIGSFYYGPYYDRYRYDDGEISYQYIAMEFLVSWYYTGKISDKFQYRVGPSVGVLSITGSDSYSPTSKNGIDIELPDTTSETRSAFTAGVGTGIIWNFHRRFFLDFGYRIMINSGIEFEERTIEVMKTDLNVEKEEFSSISNQFNITFGWRF